MQGREPWFGTRNEGLGTHASSFRGRRARRGFKHAILALLLAVFIHPLFSGDSFGEIAGTYSRDKPPESYGNILLTRSSMPAGQKEVLFTHWTHRMLYACRICHFEIGFPMGVNEEIITMDNNRSGKFCGFCHDGEKAFGTTEENCPKCHYGDGEFDYGEKVDQLSWLPEIAYGNKVDWSRALDDGDIHPIFCLEKETCKIFDMSPPDEIEMVSGSEKVPPVMFPHARHGFWLDCLNCHPGNVRLANGKVKFPEQKKNRRSFCRGCHGRIASPMDDCARCHPGMDTDW